VAVPKTALALDVCRSQVGNLDRCGFRWGRYVYSWGIDTQSAMTAEPAFLIAAVGCFLNPEATLPDARQIDWTAVLRLAAAHAVTPVLHTVLRDVPVPDAVTEELRSDYESAVRRSLAQSAELARLVGLVEEQGIPNVALKGPMLSRYLYGDLGGRTSGDIDLLVKRKDVVGVRDVLVSNGYRLTSTVHWNSAPASLRSR